MEKFRRLSLMGLIALVIVSFISCSKEEDDDENLGDPTSSFTVNNTKCQILSSFCSEWAAFGDKWVQFDNEFFYKDDLVAFSMEIPFSSVSKIKNGMELIDFIDIADLYVVLGNDNSNIGFGGGSPKFIDIEGNVKVISVTERKVTLQYSNFSFKKVQGSNERSFIFNGTLTYDIN